MSFITGHSWTRPVDHNGLRGARDTYKDSVNESTWLRAAGEALLTSDVLCISVNHPRTVTLSSLKVVLVLEAAVRAGSLRLWCSLSIRQHWGLTGRLAPSPLLPPPSAAARCPGSSPARQAPPWPLTSASAARGHHLPATNSKIYNYCEAFVNIQLHNIRQRSTRIHIATCRSRYFLRGIACDQWSRALVTRIHQRRRGNISPIFFVSYSLGKWCCTQHDPRRTPPGAP